MIIGSLLGIGLGCFHVWGMWRASRQPSWTLALEGMTRMAVIAGGLTLAAVWGQLIPCLVTWGLCVIGSVVVVSFMKPLRSPQG